MKNGLNLQRVESYPVFRHDEAMETISGNTKDTFQRIKANVILAASEKNGTQVMKVLRPMFRTCGKVI